MNILNIFKGNTSSLNNLKLELLSNDTGDVQIAFGAHWQDIVSGDGKQFAVKMAKKRGASHLVFRDKQAGIGFIDVKANGLTKTTKIYPVAQVMARRCGAAIFILKIADGEYWFCVTKNDSKILIDKFIYSGIESEIQDEVNKYIVDNQLANGKYDVYTNLEDHNFEIVKFLSVDDLIHATEGTDSFTFDNLSKAQSGSQIISKPILIGLVSLVVVVVGYQSYIKFFKKPIVAPVIVNPQDISPKEAWGKVIAEWVKSNESPKINSLKAVRESIGSTPVIFHGWRMKDTTCVANLSIVSLTELTKTWSCKSTYSWSKVSTSNIEMSLLKAHGKKIGFKNVKELFVDWDVVESVDVIKPDILSLTTPLYLEVSSAFQYILSAIVRNDAFIDFVPVQITPPKRLDGSDFALDDSIQFINTAPIQLNSPLRVIDKFSQNNIPIAWKYISVAPEIEFKSEGSMGLYKSALMAEVKGNFYAKSK